MEEFLCLSQRLNRRILKVSKWRATELTTKVRRTKTLALTIRAVNLQPKSKISVTSEQSYESDNLLFESNFDWIKEFQIIVIEIHDWMLPFHSVSRNFFKAIYEKILIDDNRDFIISGENLIIIKK